MTTNASARTETCVVASKLKARSNLSSLKLGSFYVFFSLILILGDTYRVQSHDTVIPFPQMQQCQAIGRHHINIRQISRG